MPDVAPADFLSFPGFFKAMPAEESGSRFIYMEASNEARDFQGEVVLSKALEESAGYYRQYGNVDLDHLTQIGAKKGLPDPYQYDIGRPVDVKVRGGRTWVKAAIYAGESKDAEWANRYWDSVTKLSPPKRWYPSVGGGIMERGPELGADGVPNVVVRKVRWTNIGLSLTPVNPAVPEVSRVPIGVLAKCWGPAGLDLTKALEAGHVTDSTALSGGGALRTESLDRTPATYWDFRDGIAREVRRKRVRGTAESIVEHGHREMGLSKSLAAEWAERFHADLRAGLHSQGNPT